MSTLPLEFCSGKYFWFSEKKSPGILLPDDFNELTMSTSHMFCSHEALAGNKLHCKVHVLSGGENGGLTISLQDASLILG